jgi:hypothetical protein
MVSMPFSAIGDIVFMQMEQRLQCKKFRTLMSLHTFICLTADTRLNLAGPWGAL